LHCRVDTATAILKAGADYALALKGNQPGLLREAKDQLERAVDPDRAETRRATVIATIDPMAFPGVKAIAQLESLRIEPDGRRTSHIRHFLLSRQVSAAEFMTIARAHWTIENQLHWVLDVAFCEDAARNRKDHGPQNLSTLRKLALNLIRQHPDKASIRRKIKKSRMGRPVPHLNDRSYAIALGRKGSSATTAQFERLPNLFVPSRRRCVC
jgi:predicted transposase YbfD/YdcC